MTAGEMGSKPVAHEALQAFAALVACSAESAGKCGVRGVEADGAGGEQRGELAGRVGIHPARGFAAPGFGDQQRQERRLGGELRLRRGHPVANRQPRPAAEIPDTEGNPSFQPTPRLLTSETMSILPTFRIPKSVVYHAKRHDHQIRRIT